MSKRMRPSQDALRESLRRGVNDLRATADETAALVDGSDDPLHPYSPQVFMSWVDFVDRVARPLVEADGDHDQEQAAMALYRKASPYFICVSLVMAANRVAAVVDYGAVVGEENQHD